MACKGWKVLDWPNENGRYINVCKAGTIKIKDVFAFESDAVRLEFDERGLTPLDRLSMSITF